ncbi:ankyrin repeat-containing domain protein [Mycena rosella]|uniref:Ankyrin repeat-containing domain protein n=1 Tax=Mycena rosella TaxID=1033263 RepID=A0AAD7GFZ0_MYCRO|nr:ankyrin repeat-containing domain protein [Mycena rosella]
MAEALGTLASILQLVDTALKAREYFKDFLDAPKEQQKLFSEMEDVRSLFVGLNKRVVGNPSSDAMQQMSGPLDKFKIAMMHFTERLGPVDGFAKRTKQLKWTLWSKKESGGYLEELERIKALLNLWLTMDIWDAGQSSQDKERRQAILDWISPLNFLQRQADVFSALQPGTGEWFLAHPLFQDWESGSGKILFCPGMPGAGKTVLASLVVDHLEGRAQTKNMGLGCIYLNHKETEIQTIPNLLGGLWKQLMLGKPVSKTVHALYDRHLERRTRPRLDEFSKALKSAIAEYSEVYFVIDALDEYPEHQRHLLIKQLGIFGPQINIMMTSRPHIQVDSTFPTLKILEIHASEADLCRYLDMQIQNSKRLSKHIRSRPELQSEILSKIVENCKGMFLLAKLHIESLATMNSVKSARDALQHLPKDLEHTYDEAIDRINHQNEEDKKLGLLALAWVANAKRPLSVPEFRDALAIEPGSSCLDVDNLVDMETILAVCAGLITIDETTSVVRLIHYTVQNYLDSIQSEQFPLAQTTIVSSCLTYLSFKDFDVLPESHSGRLRITHPFLEYAKYCLVHARGSPEQDLQDMIIKFLTQASRWYGFWRDIVPWDTEKASLTPLCISAACNLITIARHLLRAGIFPMLEDFFPSLWIASYHGHIDIVQLLIDVGAEIDGRKEYYENALHAASWNGHVQVLQVLIDHGASVDTPGGYALQAASFNGHGQIVRLLIEKGADVNGPGGQGWGSAIEAASANGHKAVVQLLIEKGADVNVQGGEWANAVQGASFNGHHSVVQMLLESGASGNAQGGFYGNALQGASMNGYVPIVQLLLDHGVDVNMQGGHFGNALQAASMNGHKSLVQVLINHGANVNAHGGRYGTALQAALDESQEQVVKVLLQNGAIPLSHSGSDGHLDNKGDGILLQTASYEGNESAVRLLLNNGTNVNSRGGHYGNALQAASTSGHEQLVRFLIEKGADVNARGGRYGTALQGAASQGHEALVQLLLEKGAEVNGQAGFWGNPLQAAAARGNITVVHILLENGADPRLGQYGQYGSPLQAALARNHHKVAQLLVQNGADDSVTQSYHPHYLSGVGVLE